jgi:FtsH-binding integral membrane protein
MRNPLIWVGLTLIVAIAIAFIANPLVPLFNSVISLQTLTLMLLVPFLVGLVIGYFLRMSQERRRPPVIKP